MKYALLVSAVALGMGGATAYSCPGNMARESGKGFVLAQTQPGDKNPNVTPPRRSPTKPPDSIESGGGTGSGGDSGGGAGGAGGGAGGGGGGAGGGGK